MAETLYADGTVSGSASTPANAHGAQDGTFTTDTGDTTWTHRWSLGNLTGTLDGSAVVQIVVRARRSAATASPTIDRIELFDGATSVGSDVTGWTINTTGQDITVNITPSPSIGTNGDNLRVEVATTAAGGKPADRTAVQVDSITVTVQNSVPTAILDVTDWRLYADGTESGSTPYEDAFRNAVVPTDTPFQLRFLLQNNGDTSASVKPKLQYQYIEKGGGGTTNWNPTNTTWNDVTGTSTRLNAQASGSLTDDGTTTERLAGSNTFTAGRIDEGDGAITTSTSIGSAQESEFVFSLQIDSADLADDRTAIRFRIVDDDGSSTPYDSYVRAPIVNPPMSYGFNFNGTDGSTILTTDTHPDNIDQISGTASTQTYEATGAHEGSAYGLIATSSNALVNRLWDINQGSHVYFRWYFRNESGSTVDHRIMDHKAGFEGSDETAMNVHHLNGNLQMRDIDGVVATTTTALTTGTWYRVEVHYRSESDDDANDGELEMRLYVGDSTTATETLGPFTTRSTNTEFEDFEWGNITASASITEGWDALAISNEDWIGPVSGATDRTAQLSWAELETPDAPRTVQLSWAEFETPEPPKRARISWAELELPDGARTAQITWAELEIPTAPRLAQISWAEIELPDAPRRARLSWAELEFADAPRTVQLAWAELEVPTAPRRARIAWAEMEMGDAPRRMQLSFAELEMPEITRSVQLTWAELEVPTAPRSVQVAWAEVQIPEAARRALVSWAELELPDGARAALVSWAELEVPTAPRRVQVAWTELEIPTAPRRGRVSWAELELPDTPGRSMLLVWAELQIPDVPGGDTRSGSTRLMLRGHS